MKERLANLSRPGLTAALLLSSPWVLIVLAFLVATPATQSADKTPPAAPATQGEACRDEKPALSQPKGPARPPSAQKPAAETEKEPTQPKSAPKPNPQPQSKAPAKPTPKPAPNDATKAMAHAEMPAAKPAPASKTAAVKFTTHVQPIFETRCVKCHNEEKTKGELRMDKKQLFLKGGDSGPALVAGNPDESLLVDRITLPHDDIDVMPPDEPFLEKNEIEILSQWVAAGAPWPEDVTLAAREGDPFPEDNSKKWEAKKLAAITAYPDTVKLDSKVDDQSLVVVASYDDGTDRDITELAKFQVAQNNIAKAEKNILTPLADGKTSLKISFQDKSLDIPVTVAKAGHTPNVSFNLDVMPVFMRAGCNTGACHGSARGQDGFMMSLFGYDPEGDHHRLTRELSGRRVNLALPHESLLVLKSVEAVPHTGGKRFELDSDMAKTMIDWVAQGAQFDPPEVAHPVDVKIYPPQLLLEGEGTEQQMSVRATYSDGTDRDVTDLAVFSTSNEPSVAIDEHGLITAGMRGESFVMARFEKFTVGSQVIVIPEGLKYEKPDLATRNYIDELVHDKLDRLRVVPSDLCTDREFLRRVHIDLIGLLPTPEQYDAFINDKSPDKRAKLIDQLLERKEFTEMWVMKWAELLQIRSSGNVNQGLSYKGALLYHNWLEERVANNVPMNEIVIELLSANGGTFTNPPSNFYQVNQDILKTGENVAQVFMGMRLQCAQCHNHPFDRWTMDDYYSWSAFFSQIGRKGSQDPRERIIYNRGSGEVKHIVTEQNAKPKFLGADFPETAGKDRRRVLAEWLASPENPYFAKNLANIVWSHFFGIGIIEPVDDVRVSNPASNPQLLDALAKKFTDYKYDFRRLVRDICNSRTYQLSTQTNESNENDLANFSHAQIRRMRAEVLLDTISQVTNTKNKFTGLPLGARAVQIADGRTSSYFLKTFGRAERETVCSCEVVADPNLSQALHLLNGDTVNDRIKQGGVITEAIKAGLKPDQITKDLYIRTLSREPLANEKQKILGFFKNPEQEQAILEDVFWSLLNSKEFLFNH
ncbi:MAG: DUF1549 domain-containing protein [Verrucomicrobiota bacterium]